LPGGSRGLGDVYKRQILAFAAYHLLNGIIDNYALGIQKMNLDFIKLMNSKDGHKAK
jgi:hypothetical protein